MTFTPETSRILKVMIESGKYSIPEGEVHLAAATLAIHLDPASASQPAAQGAALTVVATAVRCFGGGVWLTGATEEPLVLPLSQRTVGEAAVSLGARLNVVDAHRISRNIIIGSGSPAHGQWTVKTWWDGWIAGVRPGGDKTPVGSGRNSLTGIAAGALAVAQAFFAEIGDALAGRIAHTVSIWSPGTSETGPTKVYLPDSLWLVGLGNLGQAYLWSLSLLPYRDPRDLQLVLQDEDIVSDVNWGTSILVPRGHYGMLKTRMAEEWALDRGFRVSRFDRFLDKSTSRRPSDPPVALSGLDRIATRRLLGDVGFDRVIDCGLGGTAKDYGRFRLNVFDPSYTAARHFSGIEERSNQERNIRLPAYQEGLAKTPEAACGMAELAGASAAVPFVSAFLATLAVTQAIRIASGEAHARSMVGTIDRVEDIRASSVCRQPSPRVGYAETQS